MPEPLNLRPPLRSADTAAFSVATRERATVGRAALEAGPVARARLVAPIIAAAADRIEATRALTPDVLDALHGVRLFRTLLPRDFGGEELEPATYVEMIEVIAGADASTAWCIGQGSGCSITAAYLKPEIVHAIWGSDPRAVLAWGVGPGSTAHIVPGGYRVTGTWQFASGSRHATWLGGHCRVIAPDGAVVPLPEGSHGERTMLFRRDCAVITDNWQVMGLRGTGSDTYAVSDLFVPEDYSVCRDTDPERRQSGTLYRFTTTNLYASAFGAVALGIARAALDALVALARQKTPGLTGRMLRDSPVLQSRIALAEATLQSARAFLLQVLRESWTLAEAATLSLDQRMKIRLAATFATHQAKEVVDMAYHEAGATAIFDSNPFERRFRDINSVTQQVQARSAHFETVGAHLLGLQPNLRSI